LDQNSAVCVFWIEKTIRGPEVIERSKKLAAPGASAALNAGVAK